MNGIKIEDLSISFGEKRVISGFSAFIPYGEVTLVSGASGIGKTTLLRIIAGLENSHTGTVEGVPERVGFVFQDDRLSPDFNAVSNVRMITGRTVSREHIAAVLTSLGLGSSLKLPVKALSGGMRRRVSIAAAVLYDAPLLLLDEPFKGLDAEMKKNVTDFVAKNTAGKTVVIVTHDPSEAEYLGSKSCISLGSPEKTI